MDPTPEAIIDVLGLEPHPEGGWYAETWRATTDGRVRAAGTAIYFLLVEGEESRWHRIDAAEIWHHYAGGPLDLRVALDGTATATHRLGPDLWRGERPQAVVPPGAWQSARSAGPWSLVGCTVSPGFDFAHFEMAPTGWEPA